MMPNCLYQNTEKTEPTLFETSHGRSGLQKTSVSSEDRPQPVEQFKLVHVSQSVPSINLSHIKFPSTLEDLGGGNSRSASLLQDYKYGTIRSHRVERSLFHSYSTYVLFPVPWEVHLCRRCTEPPLWHHRWFQAAGCAEYKRLRLPRRNPSAGLWSLGDNGTRIKRENLWASHATQQNHLGSISTRCWRALIQNEPNSKASYQLFPENYRSFKFSLWANVDWRSPADEVTGKVSGRSWLSNCCSTEPVQTRRSVAAADGSNISRQLEKYTTTLSYCLTCWSVGQSVSLHWSRHWVPGHSEPGVPLIRHPEVPRAQKIHYNRKDTSETASWRNSGSSLD